MGHFVTRTGKINLTFGADSDGTSLIHVPQARANIYGRGWTDWFGDDSITSAGRFPGITEDDIEIPGPNPVPEESEDWDESWASFPPGGLSTVLDMWPFHQALLFYPWGRANASATTFLTPCWFDVMPCKITIHYTGNVIRTVPGQMHVHTIWAAGGPGACIADFLVSKVVDGVEYLERTVEFTSWVIDAKGRMDYPRTVGLFCGIVPPSGENPASYDLSNIPPLEVTMSRSKTENLVTGSGSGATTITVDDGNGTFDLMNTAQAYHEALDPTWKTLTIPSYAGRPDWFRGYSYFRYPDTSLPELAPKALIDYEIGETWMWGCSSAENTTTS